MFSHQSLLLLPPHEFLEPHAAGGGDGGRGLRRGGLPLPPECGLQLCDPLPHLPALLLQALARQVGLRQALLQGGRQDRRGGVGVAGGADVAARLL